MNPMTTERDHWIGFCKEGTDYRRRALIMKDSDQYSAQLIFHIASMSLEKLLMTVALYYGIMPFNHTFQDLADAVSGIKDFPPLLCSSIREFDQLYGICSIDDYQRSEPDERDLEQILLVIEKLEEWISTHLQKKGN
jgi:hypothetical protein